MRIPFAALAASLLLLSAPAAMAETDWSQVYAAIGKKPVISGTVLRPGSETTDCAYSGGQG